MRFVNQNLYMLTDTQTGIFREIISTDMIKYRNYIKYRN